VNRFLDDYYRHWPLEVGADEEAAEGDLKTLSPSSPPIAGDPVA
jgi:hypothetical protein